MIEGYLPQSQTQYPTLSTDNIYEKVGFVLETRGRNHLGKDKCIKLEILV